MVYNATINESSFMFTKGGNLISDHARVWGFTFFREKVQWDFMVGQCYHHVLWINTIYIKSRSFVKTISGITLRTFYVMSWTLAHKLFPYRIIYIPYPSQDVHSCRTEAAEVLLAIAGFSNSLQPEISPNLNKLFLFPAEVLTNRRKIPSLMWVLHC